MKIIEPSHEFETPIAGRHGRDLLALIERAARTCYKRQYKRRSKTAPEQKSVVAPLPSSAAPADALDFEKPTTLGN